MGTTRLDCHSWTLVSECFEYSAAARSLGEFYDRVLEGAVRLVPSTLGAICFRFEHGQPRWVRGGPPGFGEVFNARYRYLFPDCLRTIDRSQDVYAMDFKAQEHSVYVRDFLRPFGVSHILGAISGTVNISILRGYGEAAFRAIEYRRLGAFHRHLEYLHLWIRKAEGQLLLPGKLELAGELRRILTAREVQVATVAAYGLSSKDIGLALDMSPRTAEHHLANIYSKLGLGGKEALRKFLLDRRSLLGLEPEVAPLPVAETRPDSRNHRPLLLRCHRP